MILLADVYEPRNNVLPWYELRGMRLPFDYHERSPLSVLVGPFGPETIGSTERTARPDPPPVRRTQSQPHPHTGQSYRASKTHTIPASNATIRVK